MTARDSHGRPSGLPLIDAVTIASDTQLLLHGSHLTLDADGRALRQGQGPWVVPWVKLASRTNLLQLIVRTVTETAIANVESI